MQLSTAQHSIVWHQQASDYKGQVMNLLHWDELEYGQFQYDQGIAYLERYIPGDTEGICMLTRSKVFWNWWKNHWNIRDQRFLKRLPGKVKLEERIQLYKFNNSVACLINEIYPSAVVLGNDYCRMIGEVKDEIQKQAS